MNYYANNMSTEEIHNTIGMINLDSLLAGDNIYVYGGAGEDGWICDLALDIANKKKIPLETNPGINPDYPEGTTGDWSDHAPSRQKESRLLILKQPTGDLAIRMAIHKPGNTVASGIQRMIILNF